MEERWQFPCQMMVHNNFCNIYASMAFLQYMHSRTYFLHQSTIFVCIVYRKHQSLHYNYVHRISSINNHFYICNLNFIHDHGGELSSYLQLHCPEKKNYKEVNTKKNTFSTKLSFHRFEKWLFKYC